MNSLYSQSRQLLKRIVGPRIVFALRHRKSYSRRCGYTVFPRENERLLTVAKGIVLHDTLFNIYEPIVLEEGVILGHRVMLLTGRHEVGEGGVDPLPASRGPIVVRRDAWIGSGAIVLGGATIGEGAVIGAGSVVTRSVGAHEFWAGNPAHYVRPVKG